MGCSKVELTLTREDMTLAKQQALDRASAAKVTKAVGAKRGTYSDHEIELTGIIAELALCRYFGVDPDLTVYTKRGDGGADMVTKGGTTANIKATKYFKSPYLLVRDYDDKYDVYILCSVDTRTGKVKVWGYADKDLVLSYKPRSFTRGAIKSRCVPCSKLNSMDALDK